jgi:hypothetical protein
MLALILSYGNMGCPEAVVQCFLAFGVGCSPINQHVCGLQDWISEQASIKQRLVYVVFRTHIP